MNTFGGPGGSVASVSNPAIDDHDFVGRTFAVAGENDKQRAEDEYDDDGDQNKRFHRIHPFIN